MTRNEISNSDDVIDSRDVIARIEELEGELEEAGETINLESGAAEGATHDRGDLETVREELEGLKALASQGEGYGDWEHGETLIRDSYFTDYTEELLKDCGYLPKELPGWIVINFEATADNIKVDYMSLDFDGVTYWMRA